MYPLRIGASLAIVASLVAPTLRAQQGTRASDSSGARLLTGARAASERGAAVTLLDVDSLRREAPVRTLSELLTGRVPGLEVLASSGALGAASRIVLRGVSTYNATSAPQIYVDGVRVDDAAASLGVFVGGQTTSRVDDLNVEDIATIVILRGPAATAPYGTDAANGVLLVTTTRGGVGAPRVHGFSSQGLVAQPLAFPANFGALDSSGAPCGPAGVASGACRLLESNVLANPGSSPFHDGYARQYGLDVGGGGKATRYALGGQWDGFGGVYGLPGGEQARLAAAGGLRPDVLNPNYLRRTNLRGSGQLLAGSTADVTVTAGYLWSDVRLPMNDNSLTGILANGLLGNADTTINQGWNAYLPGEIFQVATSQAVRRVTGSIAASWRPIAFLTIRGTAGLDLVRQDGRQLQRTGEGPASGNDTLGYVERNVANEHRYTMGFTAAAVYRLVPGVTGRTTAGAQYFKRRASVVDSLGWALFPGQTSVLGGLGFSTHGTETSQATSGLLLEQDIVWQERVFVTAGVRHDARSRFGMRSGVAYPHAGVAWQLPISASSLVQRVRLRAAYGVAGRESAIIGAGVERTRELEGGVDAELFKGRLALEATVYDRHTSDITSVIPTAPSVGPGFIASDSGVVSNTGIELSLSATPLRTAAAHWDVTVSAWGNRNRVISVGLGPFVFGRQAVVPGLPIASYYDRPILGYADADGDGILSPSELRIGAAPAFLGSAFPTEGASLGTTLGLRQRVRVSALLEYRAGNRLWDATEDVRCALSKCRAANDPAAPLEDQAAAVGLLTYGTAAGFIHDARFVKLREVALTVEAPAAWARRVGAADLTLTLAGRNLAMWSSYPGLDPEVNAFGSEGLNVRDLFTQPLARYWTARLDLSF